MLFRHREHYFDKDYEGRASKEKILELSNKMGPQIGMDVIRRFYGELHPDIMDEMDYRHRTISLSFYAFSHSQVGEIQDMIPDEYIERFRAIRDGKVEWQMEPRHKSTGANLR